MESILDSVKKMLGIDPSYEQFDPEIIMHINSVLTVLTQLGVGPEDGYMIESKYETWADFLPEDSRLDAVKSYIYLKVKLIFDPPTSSVVMDAMSRTINELEWRLNVAVDPSN